MKAEVHLKLLMRQTSKRVKPVFPRQMSVFYDETKDNHRRCLNNSEKEDKWTGGEDCCLSSTGWVSRDPWPNDNNTQQHTPKKLSKIEVKSSTRSSLHETCPSGHDIEVKSEDYFIDFENDNILQYNVVTSETGNKSTGKTCIGKSEGISKSCIHRTSSVINQWQRANASAKPLYKALSKYANSFSQASGSETPDNFSDFQCSQELYSHYVCSQQPAPTSVRVSGYLASKNQEYQQDTQFNPSLDQGYGSHSTDSSCQGQDSEKEESVMEQGSQMNLGAEDREWSAGNGTDGDNVENDLEDLLYHFQNFFQDRFESEFRRYQEAIYSILQEQQNHVRQIVHTTLREQSSSQKSYTEELPSEDTKKMPGMLKAMSQDISFTQMLNTDYYVHVPVSVPSVSLPSAPLSNSSTVVKEETVQKRLLDLYSLSCSVSTLLAQYQFKS